MAYIRNSSKANLDALRVRQQIAAAELEKAEKELALITELERDLVRLQVRREQVAQDLKQAHNRTGDARVKLALPPIVYGGRDGLAAAVKESKDYDRRKRVA